MLFLSFAANSGTSASLMFVWIDFTNFFGLLFKMKMSIILYLNSSMLILCLSSFRYLICTFYYETPAFTLLTLTVSVSNLFSVSFSKPLVQDPRLQLPKLTSFFLSVLSQHLYRLNNGKTISVRMARKLPNKLMIKQFTSQNFS